MLIGRGEDEGAGAIAFGQLADPMARSTLLEVYRAACVGPVPLLEHASRAFAQALHDSRSQEDALDKARGEFVSTSNQQFADDRDAYVSEIYRSFDEVLAQERPLRFIDVSRRVYLPLLQHRVEL